MQPLDRFALIRAVLCTEAEDARAEGPQFLVMVSERTGLWRAASRPRDRIPAWRRLLVGPSRARVAIDDRSSDEGSQVHDVSCRRPERNRREDHPGEVVARAVIDRHREAFGQVIEVI